MQKIIERSAFSGSKRAGQQTCSSEHFSMACRKFVPVVKELPQSSVPVRGRGASWSPANRFEKLHVDLTDANLVDVDPAAEERPRRSTQYFRDGTKSIIGRNNSPDVGFETSLNPY